MNKTGNKNLLLIVSLLVVCQANAQFEFSSHFDAGQQNVSEGFFLNTALSGAYCIGKYTIEGACQASLINSGSKILGAKSMLVSRHFFFKDLVVKLEGIYINNRFSEFVREVNWGTSVELQQKHFLLGIGTNFRVYSIPRDALNAPENFSNEKIREYWNLMYVIGYTLRPVNSEWNLGINLTNTDHFFISQETNPSFNLEARVMFFPGLTLYTEAWLKRSGAFNLSVNHFGFFIRSGVIWHLNIQ